MKLATVLASTVVGLALVTGGSAAFAKSGKVESVENGGRVVVIAGSKYKISGSRTKVTIRTAVAAVAAEIMPGRPPVIAVSTAMEKLA